MVPRLRGNIRFGQSSINDTQVCDFCDTLIFLRRHFLYGRKDGGHCIVHQMSIGPNSCSMDSAAFSMAAASATSKRSTTALPTADSISRLAASSPSTPRAVKPTFAPCFPNSRAAARPRPADAPVITTTSFLNSQPSILTDTWDLDKFSHLIGNCRQRDLLSVGLSPCQRFGEVQCLLGLDLGGHGRFEGIHRGLQNCGTGSGKKLFHGPAAFAWIFQAESDAAARMSERSEVDGMKINPILGIAQENHLLPLDLSECVVLDDDHLDRKLVLHCGDEVR